MKINSRQKLIITVCGALALILVSSAAFGWLVFNTRVMMGSLENTRTKLALYANERQAADEIKTILKKENPLVERLKKTIINHERPIEFLDSMTNLGKAAGNKIVLDYSEQESDTENLVFRVTAEGKQKNIGIYLNLIELMPYTLAIEHVRWDAITTEHADTRLSIRIRVRATTAL